MERDWSRDGRVLPYRLGRSDKNRDDEEHADKKDIDEQDGEEGGDRAHAGRVACKGGWSTLEGPSVRYQDRRDDRRAGPQSLTFKSLVIKPGYLANCTKRVVQRLPKLGTP